MGQGIRDLGDISEFRLGYLEGQMGNLPWKKKTRMEIATVYHNANVRVRSIKQTHFLPFHFISFHFIRSTFQRALM